MSPQRLVRATTMIASRRGPWVVILLLGVAACGRSEIGPAASGPAAPVSAPAESAAAPAGAAASPEGPLGSIVFARSKAGTQPVDSGRRFTAGTGVVYAFFDFEGLRAEDRVTGAWYHGTAPLFEQTVTLAQVFGGSPPARGHLWLSIRFDPSPRPGMYTLDVSLNDELLESGSFAIDR